jgi:hypothetical protein
LIHSEWEILNRILHVENECDPDGPGWQCQWLKLAIRLPGETLPATRMGIIIRPLSLKKIIGKSLCDGSQTEF